MSKKELKCHRYALSISKNFELIKLLNKALIKKEHYGPDRVNH